VPLSRFSFALPLLLLPSLATAQPSVVTPGDLERDIDEYSLDELKQINLEKLLELRGAVGTLTSAGASTTPASVTTITDEDIRLTPARNIYDLLEVYVPGASWVIHSEGPHAGLRGIISDRNNKFLLLVDGRVLNQKGHSGAVTELEDWELSDIAQIDVLRGPGSVTYGPGAIAGVISITTKTARKFRGTAARAGYLMPYRSSSLSVETAFEREPFAVYAYVSRVSTPGVHPPHYFTDENNQYGYLGQGNAPRAAAFFGDYDGEAQLKAHLDVRFLKEWELWARYTSSGSSAGTTLTGNANAEEQRGFRDAMGRLVATGAPYSNRALRSRQATVTLTREHRFTRRFALKGTASFYSLDWRRRLEDVHALDDRVPDQLWTPLSDPDNLRSFAQRFSENELYARLVASLDFSERVRGALGAEWTYDRWAPGWGDPPSDFRMGDAANFISGPASPAYGYPALGGVDPASMIATTGFDQHLGSLFGELNLQLHRLASLLLSGRIDRSNRSGFLVSPRAALVSRPGDRHVVKLIWQRAERLNTGEQLYYDDRLGRGPSPPEVLTGYEGIYSFLATPDLHLALSAFYNRLDAIGWSSERSATLPLGTLQLAGGELELAYSGHHLRLGLNHSFVKQISWKLNPMIKESGISYASYDYTGYDGSGNPLVHIGPAGNDLDNWSNHATKLFLHARPFAWLALHLDSQVFWGYPGARDGLTALLHATMVSEETAAGIAASVAALRAHHVYGVNLRANASISVSLSPALTVTAYAMNVFGVGGFKRYNYDAGNVMPAPVRNQYIREPLAVGARLAYSW
jgi:outer membrane receptor protein involved in Fe transport